MHEAFARRLTQNTNKTQTVFEEREALSVQSVAVSYYPSIASMLGSLAVCFSVIDLLTTAIALDRGLRESNLILVAISNLTGTSLVGALAALKLIFLAGLAVAFYIGLRTNARAIRVRALLVLLFLASLLLVVSVNNIYWI